MKTEHGFTLPELLAIGVIGLMFVGILLAVVRPQNYDAEMQNAERRLELAQIMQSIVKYEAEHGTLPPHLTQEETVIATGEEDAGLCEDLVPQYLDDLPRDPTLGVVLTDAEPCNAADQLYTTGYTASRSDTGHVILTAPAAADDETITIARWFSFL